MTRVRLASVRDYPFCAGLSEQAMRLHLDGRPDLFSAPLSPALSRPGFEGMLQNPDFLLLVAEEAGAVRGFLIARRQGNKAYRQEELFVESLVVDAAHRGRGLGRALMDFLELEARRRGYACLALQVWEFNQAAQAFYARIGYRPRSHILEKPL